MKRLLLVLALLLAGLAGQPVAQAQEAGPLFFPATGHTLDDTAGFLGFWQAHDGERILGLPISEAIPQEGGAIQYFERARLEQATGADGQAFVRVGPVAREYLELIGRQVRAAPPRPEQAGVRYFEETGHALRQPFLSFWEQAGGEAIFGAPISDSMWENTTYGPRRVQYFSNARIERNASLAGTADEFVVSDLGRALAALRGIDQTPLGNPGYAEAGPALPAAPDVAPLYPTPVPPTPAPPAARPPAQPAVPRANSTGGPKSIVVNLSKQWLYAYEGDTLVFKAPVATGRDGMETPTGTFSIYAKLRSQTMDGVTNGEYWVVPNVPHVMYIYGGVALHGTYWHNLFGTGARPSHGCVNLPLKSAAWLYDWAPMGTPVRVTY